MSMSWCAEERKKALSVLSKLGELVIGQHAEALVLGLTSGLHVLLHGPPGTAKTYSVKVLSRLVEGKYYFAQLHPTTVFDDLFGVLDPAKLVEGKVERSWTDIVRSDVVFLDEVDKGERVQPALLTFMQERAVYDPQTGQKLETPLHMLVGASNKVVLGQDSLPFFDRFGIVARIRRLGDEETRIATIRKWLQSDEANHPLASIDDFRRLSKCAVEFLRSKLSEFGGLRGVDLYNEHVLPYLVFASEHGIHMSDRKKIEHGPLLYAGYVMLYGPNVDNVLNAVFDILPYLVLTEDDMAKLHGLLIEELGELYRAQMRLEWAKEDLLKGDTASAREKLRKVREIVERAEAGDSLLRRERREAILRTLEWIESNVLKF